MALCQALAFAYTVRVGLPSYQVLAQLDEDSTILLQDLQCPLSTSFVALPQYGILFFWILGLLALVQRRPVAV